MNRHFERKGREEDTIWSFTTLLSMLSVLILKSTPIVAKCVSVHLSSCGASASVSPMRAAWREGSCPQQEGAVEDGSSVHRAVASGASLRVRAYRKSEKQATFPDGRVPD